MKNAESLPRDGGMTMTIDQFVHRGIGADLSLLACHAAIELEGALSGQLTKLDAVANLATAISANRQGEGESRSAFLLDPTATVVLSQALLESRLVQEPIEREDELVPLTHQVALRLNGLVNSIKSGSSDSVEVAVMRDFCLALSEGISDSLPSIYEDNLQFQSRS